MTAARPLALANLLLTFALTPVYAADKPADKDALPAEVSFYKDVRPIFQQHCNGCHQPAKPSGGFDMTVIHHSRTAGDPACGYRGLEDLLREADIVTLHAPLATETRGLISRERLALLRNGTTLVNAARGALVDENALVDELVSGRISAGLDVFVHEPHVPDRLFGLPNVVLTPHIGSATVETRAAMTRIVVDNVLAAERGEPLLTPVPA